MGSTEFPTIFEVASIQYNIKLPPVLMEHLKSEAAMCGRPVNKHLAAILAARYGLLQSEF